MHHGQRPRGFTLVELLVVIGIIGVLIGILLPVLSNAQEASRRVKCQSNVRQIGVALLAYASANNGHFPRTAFQSNGATGLVIDETGNAAVNPFTAAGITATGHNNVPASIFLLLRARLLTPEVMVCPSAVSASIAEVDDYGGEESPLKCSNFSAMDGFGGRNTLSYAMQVPFPHQGAMSAGFTWSNNLDPAFVLAADINPNDADVANGQAAPTAGRAAARYNMTSDELMHYNSPNHRTLMNKKEGQNVLYADGHVEFQRSPYCGPWRKDLDGGANRFRDNIYTANPDGATEASQVADATNNSRPVKPVDNILMPMFPAP